MSLSYSEERLNEEQRYLFLNIYYWSRQLSLKKTKTSSSRSRNNFQRKMLMWLQFSTNLNISSLKSTRMQLNYLKVKYCIRQKLEKLQSLKLRILAGIQVDPLSAYFQLCSQTTEHIWKQEVFKTCATHGYQTDGVRIKRKHLIENQKYWLVLFKRCLPSDIWRGSEAY